MITYATFIYKTVTFDKVMIYLIGLMTVWKLQVLYIFIISHIFLFLLLPHKFLIISSRKHASTNEQIKQIKNKINMISEFFVWSVSAIKTLKHFFLHFFWMLSPFLITSANYEGFKHTPSLIRRTYENLAIYRDHFLLPDRRWWDCDFLLFRV